MHEKVGLFGHFMPHGMCYQWRPDILWLNVGSDAVIAFSYLLIPAALLFYMLKKKNSKVSYPSLIYMFCLFIFACGVTHLFGIWTVWNGQYGIQGIVKSFTAAASIATVVMLFPTIPKVLALRTPRELELANIHLKQEMEQRAESERQNLKLQSELALVGRITTVGQMATGLAHELNQPLLAISASADTAVNVAKSSQNNDPVLYECLEDIQKDTQRAGEIISTLRQFVSEKSTSRSSVNVNELVTEVVPLLASDARNANVEIEVRPGEIPLVNVNSVQISQVLVNLLRNAIEAISSSTSESDNKLSITNRIIVESQCDGNDVLVSVIDNGPGIHHLDDPFTPFESKKPDGMGVGLSISRDIVEAHGGRLQFTSDSSSGTTFTFNLPLAAV